MNAESNPDGFDDFSDLAEDTLIALADNSVNFRKLRTVQRRMGIGNFTRHRWTIQTSQATQRALVLNIRKEATDHPDACLETLPTILTAAIATVDLPFGTYRFFFEPKEEELTSPSATVKMLEPMRDYIVHPLLNLHILRVHMSLATQELLVSTLPYDNACREALPTLLAAPVETVEMPLGAYRIVCEPV